MVIRDNTFINVQRGINVRLSVFGGANITNASVLNNTIAFTGAGIGFEVLPGHYARGIRIAGNVVYLYGQTPGGAALSINGNTEFSADNNILDGGGGSGLDFFSSGAEFDRIKVLSFKDNGNLRGKPLTVGEYADREGRLRGFYEEEITFTPVSTGWHKVALQFWGSSAFSSSRLNIFSFD